MQRTQHRLAALTLSTLFTLVMLMAMNHLATSQPPAGLMAQLAQATAQT